MLRIGTCRPHCAVAIKKGTEGIKSQTAAPLCGYQ